MTKLAFAIGLINHLRLQKNPPLARYCCLLSLAESPGRRMTAPQIFRRFGLKEALSGTLECAVRQGLVDALPGKTVLYRLTPEGQELVRKLLDSATDNAATER